MVDVLTLADVCFAPSLSGAGAIVGVVLLGLIAGVLGGMLGVGGSIIMIPGLTLLFGYDQHLYQAAAMIANVAVSVPAAMRHYKAGAIEPRALKPMAAAALACVMLGVWLSNLAVFAGRDGGVWLGRVLALLMVYVMYINVRRLRRDRAVAATVVHDLPVLPEVAADDATETAAFAPSSKARSPVPGRAHGDMEDPSRRRVTPVRSAAVGSMMGLIAGLLGVGGGAIAVPMQQVLLRLPLRVCIANSSAIICLSAAFGAVYKNASLPQHGRPWWAGLLLALLLAPTCWLGGHLGAVLTHKLPIWQVRLAFIALMAVAALKMAKLDAVSALIVGS